MHAVENAIPQSQRSPPMAAVSVLAGLVCWVGLGPTLVGAFTAYAPAAGGAAGANIGLRWGNPTDVEGLEYHMYKDTRYLMDKATDKRGIFMPHPEHRGLATDGCWKLAVKDYAGEIL
jgi:hypothetical protein